MGKDLTEVRSLQRTLVPDTVGPGKHEPTSLQGIANKAKACKRNRFRDLYRCLDVELLMHCWGALNKGAAGEVAPVKTCLLRFSRSHPSMKRRLSFLGFEFYWWPDRQGVVRVQRRTARKKLQAARRRIKEWIRRTGTCRDVTLSEG